MNSKQVELFIYWINERERIRLVKERGDPWPWTQNPHLRDRHFCNIRREDDRGTKEIHAVRKEFPSMSLPDYPMFYTAARLFNKASTVREYWKHGAEFVKEMQEEGEVVFHTAYMVSTCGVSMNKVDYVDDMVRRVSRVSPSMLVCNEAFAELRTVDGLGSFMCGQIIADLKYTNYLKNAVDFDEFAVMGPGSKKGLDLIFGPGTTETTFMHRLKVLRAAIKSEIPKLHNQDLQNCLCEFSKFSRYTTNGRGRNRNYDASIYKKR